VEWPHVVLGLGEHQQTIHRSSTILFEIWTMYYVLKFDIDIRVVHRADTFVTRMSEVSEILSLLQPWTMDPALATIGSVT
jgi:hypothetical protein